MNQPVEFQLGSNEHGIVLRFGPQAIVLAPADALRVAATICGLVAERAATEPASPIIQQPRLVVPNGAVIR